MRKHLKLMLLPICAVVLVGWAASFHYVERTLRGWTSKDVGLRAQLAVRGAHEALVTSWGQAALVTTILEDIVRDERISGAAACTVRGEPLAQTSTFSGPSCAAVAAEKADGLLATTPNAVFEQAFSIDVVPLLARGTTAGFVVLQHDLSFANRRAQKARAFMFMALLTLVALMAADLALVHGDIAAHLADAVTLGRVRLRIAAQRLRSSVADLREEGMAPGPWSPQRLQAFVSRRMPEEQIIVVANRSPLTPTFQDGGTTYRRSSGGLVAALEPVVKTCGGTWIASMPREAGEAPTDLFVDTGEYRVRHLPIPAEEYRSFYNGAANEAIWPLCHLVDERPVFRPTDWETYRSVNAQFAQEVRVAASNNEPVVLVQDYQLALAPRAIRTLMPNAAISTFWHIPWPSPERWSICPWRQDIVRGLLGSNIIGFQTPLDAANFIATACTHLPGEVRKSGEVLSWRGREIIVQSYPISVDWSSLGASHEPAPAVCRRILLDELNLPQDCIIGVGVDRMDYTKGIEERLLAFERTLERTPTLHGKLVFVQVGAPTRVEIPRYRQLADNVTALADRINARFGTSEVLPVVLHKHHVPPDGVARLFRAADFCYVSSLHDGMNLVAKEFVAARNDEFGVLILSQFTGAAVELSDALIVNPYDIDGASNAIIEAVSMPQVQQRRRMQSLRDHVSEHNVHRWAARLLSDTVDARERERMKVLLAQSMLAVPRGHA
jgi:trehalose 6-phosphate synthase